MKVTLSFKGSKDNQNGNILKNVQVEVGLPAHVMAEQNVFKFPEMNFERQTTPQVVQLYLYPTKGGYPVDTLIKVSVTYS